MIKIENKRNRESMKRTGKFLMLAYNGTEINFRSKETVLWSTDASDLHVIALQNQCILLLTKGTILLYCTQQACL
jgi:hypothetical protein